jgi:uncharacterized protein
MVGSKSEIAETISLIADEIRELGVESLALFGSFVHGTASATSDVDILVEFKAGSKRFANFMALSALLEQSLGRDVDLVTTESISPYIKPYILKDLEYVKIIH